MALLDRLQGRHGARRPSVAGADEEGQVATPEEFTGNVTGDLTARRGMVQGMDEIPGSGGKLIAALVPLADMFGYSTTLRSLTQGRGNLFDGVQALRRGTGPRPRAGRGVGQGRALAAEGPPAETAYRASEPPSTERIAPVV
ncbi:MAG: fusA [Collimonas fungivorans]|jgi:hypothetical protein|nr:fusA [Collimonas fungivorans]